MISQTSSIFVEVHLVYQIKGIRGMAFKEVGSYINIDKNQSLEKVRIKYIIEIRR